MTSKDIHADLAQPSPPKSSASAGDGDARTEAEKKEDLLKLIRAI